MGLRVGATAQRGFSGLGREQNVVDVSERRGICRNFDKARHVPFAGKPVVSVFNEE